MVKKDTTNERPRRMLGRLDESSWEEMKLAANRAGYSFTEWAVGILLDAAQRPRRAPMVAVKCAVGAPPRQLGRVSQAAWDRLQEAAGKAGMSFTDWSIAILRAAARDKHAGFDVPEDQR